MARSATWLLCWRSDEPLLGVGAEQHLAAAGVEPLTGDLGLAFQLGQYAYGVRAPV